MLDVTKGEITGIELAIKDRQTVTARGEGLIDPIAGVALHRPRTQADERGTLCEIYDERWGFTDEPVPFVYLVTIRPGQVKGWSVHLEQDDNPNARFIADEANKVEEEAVATQTAHDQDDPNPTPGANKTAGPKDRTGDGLAPLVDLAKSVKKAIPAGIAD